MFDNLLEAVPLEWRPTLEFLLSALVWIPAWQAWLLEWIWSLGGSFLATVAARALCCSRPCSSSPASGPR